MNLRAIAAVVAACAVATPAMAERDMTRPQPGFVYYNKPGADLKTHEADMTACLGQAANMLQPVDTRLASAVGVFAVGVIPAMIAGAIAGATNGLQIGSGLITNVENCMVVRGWRVVGLEKEEGKALSKLAPAALAERLSPWIGAEQPHGVILRVWSNDLTRPDVRIYDFAGGSDEPPLSLAVWGYTVGKDRKETDGALITAKPTALYRAYPRGVKPPKPLKPVKAGKIPDLPEGHALVIVRITGPNAHRGQTLHFFRPGPDGTTWAWDEDRLPSTFTATMSAGLITAAGKPLDTIVAYAVPAGKWRLEAISEEGFNVALCFGAPSFEVKPGEAVFAGSFDLAAPHVGPDLSVAPATAFLASRPDMAARVRPAAWTNGDVFPCMGQWMYALEFRDAPFAPGYAWGGAAPPSTRVAASE